MRLHRRFDAGVARRPTAAKVSRGGLVERVSCEIEEGEEMMML